MTDTHETTDVDTSAVTVRFGAARAVADATLYEGYVLYPYRASAAKNQIRWQFGVLAPRSWAEADGSERWRLRTECVVDPGPASRLTIRVRFLQLQQRTIEARIGETFTPVESLDIGDVNWVPWNDAVERVVDLTGVALRPSNGVAVEQRFSFEGGSSAEDLVDEEGLIVGRIVRRWEQLHGAIEIDARSADGVSSYVTVSIGVANTSTWGEQGADRDRALAHSLLGAHTLLAIDDGRFISLLDPPPDAQTAVAACRNEGTFPVLVADPTARTDVVLSSPITLYDHPVVAPESQGDLYDSTEIDEILALRILTLTDEEKAEARGTDARAAAIVDRCDTMPPEVWERLHGVMRDLGSPIAGSAGQDEKPWWDPSVDAEVDPWSDVVCIAGVDVAKGVRVVLRPSRRSDAQDLFLAGRAATVAGVFHDVDGTQQVAVTVDDDPATEALSWQGRYLFFFPDEIEVIGA